MAAFWIFKGHGAILGHSVVGRLCSDKRAAGMQGLSVCCFHASLRSLNL